MNNPTSEDFEKELNDIFQNAKREGHNFIDVVSGELHRQVGGYPNGGNHRMPVCCMVMRHNKKEGDELLYEPPKGKGATLKIRYKIPR